MKTKIILALVLSGILTGCATHPVNQAQVPVDYCMEEQKAINNKPLEVAAGAAITGGLGYWLGPKDHKVAVGLGAGAIGGLATNAGANNRIAALHQQCLAQREQQMQVDQYTQQQLRNFEQMDRQRSQQP